MRAQSTNPVPASVRGNDWRAVPVAPLAAFEPRAPLSVVVPCYGTAEDLAPLLAALERQTLPRRLFEVVVVDDGSEPPLAPPPAALNVRVVRQARRGFGLARARNLGVRAARHAVVVFLDADLVPEADLLCAHARWHETLSDACTLGFCAYVSAAGVTAGAVRACPGPLGDLFAGRRLDRPWTERHMVRTGDLTSGSHDLFRAVTASNLGIRRDCFEALGGFDESFGRYGWEDTEFGWRAQAAGALLVPERAAAAWHRGRYRPSRDAAKRRDVAAQAALGAGLMAHPDFRAPGRGARWPVPGTAVTVRAAVGGMARIRETVARLLDGEDDDLAVIVDAVPADRAAAAAFCEALRETRGVPVRPGTGSIQAYPATPVHVTVPAGAAFGGDLLARLRAGLGGAALGRATLADGTVVEVARSWAVHRARRAGGRPSDYGAVAVFRVASRDASLARAWRRSWRRLAAGPSRPLGGLARLAAEASRVRDIDGAVRVLGWLAAGARWWIGQRRGHGQGAPGVRPSAPGGAR